ncbi:DUF6226 family protein [Mycetocola reblochoni]|uniref:Uncharacterized protein n=2 Tax=Mycetocola reblochoni TaxID=331618 RepID=A0A1R4K3L0_9MICO|nr:DUF6226 family protein [Mycetocola reblochoni]RLP67705.1 hypothetical protein D9V30_13250 [Mycetocola reblochoni]SJN38665.1 hypothetical protein FM119_11075 [Mycetocola reblochoni REB411]
MSEYIRPQIGSAVFRDDAGGVIAYGARWDDRDGSPPEESYSVVSHPERFAPLHLVATAVVDELVRRFDVDVEEGAQQVDGLLGAPDPARVVRAIRLTPRDEACAPLVVVLTDFPGIWVSAGVLHTAAYPSCGCDACDEVWTDAADEFEWQTFAVASGGFSEGVNAPRRPRWTFQRGIGFVKGMGQTVTVRLVGEDGQSEMSGESRAEDVPPALLARLQARLAAIAARGGDGGWQRWPDRAAGDRLS